MEGKTARRTDMTKLIVAFRDFANAPKMERFLLFVNIYCCKIICNIKLSQVLQVIFFLEKF
jgi:hypothetical protein